jgi:hypothetical protein
MDTRIVGVDRIEGANVFRLGDEGGVSVAIERLMLDGMVGWPSGMPTVPTQDRRTVLCGRGSTGRNVRPGFSTVSLTVYMAAKGTSLGASSRASTTER